MNINAGIIDQQISTMLAEHSDWLPYGDETRRRSAGFVLLCMAHFLDIPLNESMELLTDGGQDAGVDGLQLGEIDDGEFQVTLFQGKYKIRNLEGTANFPENDIQKAIATVQLLFDPYRQATLNPRLKPKVEEIRSLIGEGYIPRVRVVLCNNGARWNQVAQGWIDQAEQAYAGKLEFVHFNHDAIVQILSRTTPVDVTLQLSGRYIVEDMNFMRVFLGRVSVTQIADLFERHGDRLLQRNIRRYLGLHQNRVNQAIQTTLSSDKSDKFYFYNNGLTVVCDKFDYNAFQQIDPKITLKNMQIINGGQTCKTIHEVLCGQNAPAAQSAYVMIRAYQLSEENQDFVHDITFATNSQNPVDLRDLHSNDTMQRELEIGIKQLGYTYKLQREESGSGPHILSSATVAEAVLAIWRERPHQAKFLRREHFGKLYQDIFKGLNAAQAVLAVLIYRTAENERKRPSVATPPVFLPYASHYLSMLMGRALIADQQSRLGEVHHQSFAALAQQFEDHAAHYHTQATSQLEDAIRQCYGSREISLQQLSATFRRGDLLEMLRP